MAIRRPKRDSVSVYTRVSKAVVLQIEAELARTPDLTISAVLSRLIESGLQAENEGRHHVQDASPKSEP